MNAGWLLMGLLLLTLYAAPAIAAAQENAAPGKATPVAQEDSTATQEAVPAKKEAARKGKEQALPEVVVETKRLVEKQDTITIKSEGLPAEVNIITEEDLKKTPYTGNYQDILRKVPGVYMSRYASPGMGDQIGMRGFAGSHGRQVAVFIDGMPMNFKDFLHGTADIDWLIPEMIERIEVIKGPFSALYGEESLAGVINITTKKSDPSPSLAGYGGTFGTGRGVGVFSDPSWSKSLGNVTPFLVWEGYTRAGYQDNSQYNRGQFFNKFTFPLWHGYLSVRGHYVARSWGRGGYLPVEAVKQGLSRRSAINDTDRGANELATFVVNYTPKGGEAGFHGTLYYAYHGENMGSTSSPSPQTRRDDFEHSCGWKLLYNYLPFENLSLTVGSDLRHEEDSQTQWQTVNYYTFTKQTRQYKFHYFSTGIFAQGQYKPFSFLKLIGGLRYDVFQIEVDNRLYPQNSGNCSPDLFSPKIGVVLTPYKDINFFANKGKSFRSPGATELSPYSATQKANFSVGLAELDSWDVGFNALLWNRIYVAFDYFNTRYTGEQWLNPGTQTYENLGTSKRTGIEVELKIFLTKELTFYGSFTDIRARLKNPTTAGAYYITGVPNDMSIVGLEFQKPWGGGDHQIGLDFYYRRISRRPLNTTGTIIGSQFDQYLGKATYRYKKWTVSLDAVFSPRRYVSENDYVSNNQITFTPLPKWEVLAGLRYQF